MSCVGQFHARWIKLKIIARYASASGYPILIWANFCKKWFHWWNLIDTSISWLNLTGKPQNYINPSTRDLWCTVPLIWFLVWLLLLFFLFVFLVSFVEHAFVGIHISPAEHKVFLAEPRTDLHSKFFDGFRISGTYATYFHLLTRCQHWATFFMDENQNGRRVKKVIAYNLTSRAHRAMILVSTPMFMDIA